MKKLLIICGLMLPLFTVAQKVEISAEGGAGEILSKKYSSNSVSEKNPAIYSYGIKGAYNISHHWQAGLGVQVNVTNVTDILVDEGPQGSYVYAAVDNEKSNTYIPYLFVNRKFYTGKSYFYAGVKAGMILTHDKVYSGIEAFGDLPKTNNTGLVLGLQAGYNIYISHHFSVYVELCPTYYQITYQTKSTSPKETDTYITGMAGVKYSF